MEQNYNFVAAFFSSRLLTSCLSRSLCQCGNGQFTCSRPHFQASFWAWKGGIRPRKLSPSLSQSGLDPQGQAPIIPPLYDLIFSIIGGETQLVIGSGRQKCKRETRQKVSPRPSWPLSRIIFHRTLKKSPPSNPFFWEAARAMKAEMFETKSLALTKKDI